MEEVPFGIRWELIGHEGAVRAITELENGTIITGAMDSVVRSWIPNSEENAEELYISLDAAMVYDHEHWVTSVLYLPPSTIPECPYGGYITGSMDKNIRIYNAENSCIAQLSGHEGGIISLSLSADKSYLLSGSWDGTARIWDLASKATIHVLSGHENGVCVLGLPDGTIVTGSTGKQVNNAVEGFQLRFWNASDFSLQKKIVDHAGPIRQLALLHEDIGFVSCSNDGTIKTRTLDGKLIATMSHPINSEGKPGFVLGVCILSDGLLVSVSEDCTARIWNPHNGSLIQSIEHPTGLWCVYSLANGDFITGGDDKIARIFTRRKDSLSALAITSFNSAVENARLVKQRGPSGIEIASLPHYDERNTVMGRSDMQIQMFQRGNKAWACQWSAPSRTWLDIGEVTGTGSGGVVDGEAYDMVIPVEIEMPDGLRKLEIGYNQGMNPFTVAQNFIDKYSLNQSYLKEIADYITQRAGEYQAPIIGEQDSTVENTSSIYNFFPIATYNTFETTKISKLLSTLIKFNDQYSSESESTMTLSQAEISAIERVVNVIQDTAYYHSTQFRNSDLAVLIAILSKWPASKVFPILDCLRLVMIHPHGPTTIGLMELETLIDKIMEIGLQSDVSGEVIPDATRMLSLRVIANMFLHKTSQKAVISKRVDILGNLHGFLQYHKKTIALSLSTILLNFSRLEVENPRCLTATQVKVLVLLATELLNGAWSLQELGDDTILRVIVMLGTYLCTRPHEKQAIKDDFDLNKFVLEKSSSINSQGVQQCIVELQQLYNE